LNTDGGGELSQLADERLARMEDIEWALDFNGFEFAQLFHSQRATKEV